MGIGLNITVEGVSAWCSRLFYFFAFPSALVQKSTLWVMAIMVAMDMMGRIMATIMVTIIMVVIMEATMTVTMVDLMTTI